MHTHWRVDRNLESGQDAHLSSINALSPLALVLLPLFLPQLLFLQPINLLATLLTHSGARGSKAQVKNMFSSSTPNTLAQGD